MPDLSSWSLKQPALLMGNGLNNYSGMPCSWRNLLIQLSNDTNVGEILDEGCISYPEFFDSLCFNLGLISSKYQSLKPQIKEIIQSWEGESEHKECIDFARKNALPILTTNYDTALISPDLLEKINEITGNPSARKFAPIIPKNRLFTDFYPWHCYYSDKKINNSNNEFAIWHIHGYWFYQRSLTIGSMDYASHIHRMKSWLYGKNYQNIGKNRWVGSNSWLDIFLHNDLVIVGLSLDVQETSLRWLFMEREKYFRDHPGRRKKTLYFNNLEFDGSVNASKRYFFDALNIEIVNVKTSKELYSQWKI